MADVSNRDLRLVRAAESFIKVGDEEAASVLLGLSQSSDAKKLLSRLSYHPKTKKTAKGLNIGFMVGLVALVALISGGLGYMFAFQSFIAQAQNLGIENPIMATIAQDVPSGENATMSDMTGGGVSTEEFLNTLRLTQEAIEIQSTDAAIWMQETSDAARQMNPIRQTQEAALTQIAATATAAP